MGTNIVQKCALVLASPKGSETFVSHSDAEHNDIDQHLIDLLGSLIVLYKPRLRLPDELARNTIKRLRDHKVAIRFYNSVCVYKKDTIKSIIYDSVLGKTEGLTVESPYPPQG